MATSRTNRVFALSFGPMSSNATIICGVPLSRHKVIAFGSVVAKDVPDYALVMGNPARQKGWMSRHGHLSKHPDKNGVMVGPESGLRYLLSTDALPNAHSPLSSSPRLRCLDLETNSPLPPHLAVESRTYDEFKTLPPTSRTCP